MPIPPKGGSDAETIIPVDAIELLQTNRIFTARNLFPAVFLATASRGRFIQGKFSDYSEHPALSQSGNDSRNRKTNQLQSEYPVTTKKLSQNPPCSPKVRSQTG